MNPTIRSRFVEAHRGDSALPGFSGNAYTGAVMTLGGQQRIIIDMNGISTSGQRIPVLRLHNHDAIVGHSTDVSVDRDGLRVKGVFSGQPEHVNSVLVPGKNGSPWQLSIGADPGESEYLDRRETAVVNGRTVKGPATIVRTLHVGEVSFVPLGADGNTSAKIAARMAHARVLAQPERKRRHGPHVMVGVAAKLNQLISNAGEIRGDGPISPSNRLMFLNGAFDRSVQRINSGRRRCVLVLGHSGALITDDLQLQVDGDELLVSTEDRAAVRFLKSVEDTHSRLSIGARTKVDILNHGAITFEGYKSAAIEFAHRADVFEVAVVKRGACPGCRFQLF